MQRSESDFPELTRVVAKDFVRKGLRKSVIPIFTLNAGD